MNYIDYIKLHVHEINNPKSFVLSQVYSKNMNRLEQLVSNNREFKEVYDTIPINRELYRTDIFNAFGDNNEHLYEGYIYTILWGGLGLTDWRNITSAVSYSKAEIIAKLSQVKLYLESDNYKSAFDYFSKEGKIKGIGISYFTKILYFMYRGNQAIRPLIYDKWGQHIHAALLIDNNDIVSDYGYISIVGNSLRIRRKTQYRCYYDYLAKMKDLSESLHLNNSGILEEYLFGYTLDIANNKNNNNPRYFVKNYLISYLRGKLFANQSTEPVVNTLNNITMNAKELIILSPDKDKTRLGSSVPDWRKVKEGRIINRFTLTIKDNAIPITALKTFLEHGSINNPQIKEWLQDDNITSHSKFLFQVTYNAAEEHLYYNYLGKIEE